LGVPQSPGRFKDARGGGHKGGLSENLGRGGLVQEGPEDNPESRAKKGGINIAMEA